MTGPDIFSDPTEKVFERFDSAIEYLNIFQSNLIKNRKDFISGQDILKNPKYGQVIFASYSEGEIEILKNMIANFCKKNAINTVDLIENPYAVAEPDSLHLAHAQVLMQKSGAMTLEKVIESRFKVFVFSKEDQLIHIENRLRDAEILSPNRFLFDQNLIQIPYSNNHHFELENEEQAEPIKSGDEVFYQQGIGFFAFKNSQKSLIPFKQFYSAKNKDFFYTTDEKPEKLEIGEYAHYPNSDTSVLCFLLEKNAQGAVPLRRWYNAKAQDHLYAVEADEGELRRLGYQEETYSPVGYVFRERVEGTVPVYLYSTRPDVQLATTFPDSQPDWMQQSQSSSSSSSSSSSDVDPAESTENEGETNPELEEPTQPDAQALARNTVIANDKDGGRDLLNIGQDVDAFARVITYKDTKLPLAIGLFGKWGSGKSFFMGQLESKIGELKGDDYCQNTVHIKFNAWHYVEENIWASLMTAFYRQLEDYFQKLSNSQDQKSSSEWKKVKQSIENEKALIQQKEKEIENEKSLVNKISSMKGQVVKELEVIESFTREKYQLISKELEEAGKFHKEILSAGVTQNFSPIPSPSPLGKGVCYGKARPSGAGLGGATKAR